jgi:hypothetical protein
LALPNERAAVSRTALHLQRVENMSTELAGVPMVSPVARNGVELIDSAELADRWKVPESWIRNHTRACTPKEARIPCVRLGRYVRFEWGAPHLVEWLAKHRE